MDAILHILGICPDSFGHVDLLDIVACYYGELVNIINIIKIRIGS